MDELYEAVFYKAYKLLYRDIASFLRENIFIIELVMEHGLGSWTWELVEENLWDDDSRIVFLRDYISDLSLRSAEELVTNFKLILSTKMFVMKFLPGKASLFDFENLETAWKNNMGILSSQSRDMALKVMVS